MVGRNRSYGNKPVPGPNNRIYISAEYVEVLEAAVQACGPLYVGRYRYFDIDLISY